MRRYKDYRSYLKARFGHEVRRVSIDAGFTCPNVDGTLARGGCIFCDNKSFTPARGLGRIDIRPQIDAQIGKLKNRFNAQSFLAYFQAASNTYHSVEHLRHVYDQAVAHPNVNGLIISTRPDTVPDPVLDLIDEYAKRMYVSVEYGLQSIHASSLAWMNRGHSVNAYLDAMKRSRGRHFDVCTHVILGLPGESRMDAIETAKVVAESGSHSVKIHSLHVVKHTRLAQEYLQGKMVVLERDDYIETLIDFLEWLDPGQVIQRLMGDAPPKHIIAPLWTLDKQAFLREVDRRMLERNTFQGRLNRNLGCGPLS